jgi:ribonuclease R
MPVNPADILDFLKNAPRPLTVREILDGLNISSRKIRTQTTHLIQIMADEGTLIRLKGDRYSLPKQVNLVIGTLSVHRDGFGFVAQPPPAAKDLFIPARYLREAMHGDRVVARVERGWRGAGPEGRVIRVLDRAHRTLVGRYEAGRRFGYVVAADPRLTHDLFIAEGAQNGAKHGQMVVARIDVYPGKTRNPEGTVIEILGAPDDPEVEVLTIAHKHGLPYRFPEEVLAQAQGVPQAVDEKDLVGREDLRLLPFVTIDGESAKDFDDAVTVRQETGGRTRLWVAIADVGSYVAEGSAIDAEALVRGTSVYFPGRAIPMLPESLSNGICSLNPEVDRLAMTAEILFDSEGKRLESRFYPAVIRSQARLTYTEVRNTLNGEPSPVIRPPELPSQLTSMAYLAQRLTAMRRRRGSLDFDLPEAEIILDLRGKPENIVRSERSMAHRLIEEFMLAANEAVAAFLREKQSPLLYRVHEPPDLEKLQAFQEFVSHFNHGLVIDQHGVDPRRLQQLLAEVEGKPEERVINQVLLRSMKQARYSSENIGHFGLAAPLYCHFTSPIRRYPDLLVHRVLRQVLHGGGLSEHRRTHWTQILPERGEQTSQRERRAMEAEREVVALKKCQFMADKVGEAFAGFVSGVQPFGFFVELTDFFVEGLVHISSLGDDFYQYEEDLHRLIGQNSRRQFQVGAEVRVAVAKVDLERREIDFALADEAGNYTRQRRPIKRGKGRG